MQGGRPLTRRATLAGLLGGAVALALPAGGRGTAWAATGVSHADPTGVLFERIATYRRTQGLAPVAVDHHLARVAHAWSGGMAARGALSHNADRDAQYGWPTDGHGEVVGRAAGTDLAAQAHRIVDSWIASPGHREILLGDYSDIGIGCAVTDQGELFATANLISVPVLAVGREALSLSAEMIATGSAHRVVVTGDGVAADALSASGLVDGNTPLLLARTGQPLAPLVLAEIDRAATADAAVYLVGGGLLDQAEEQIRALGRSPVRLRGATRFETSAAVAHEVARVRGTPWRILLANGTGWADAVAAGAFAARHGTPVVLTTGDRIHPAAAEVLAAFPDADRVVVGGERAVGDALVRDVGAWRIDGRDRAETGSRVMRDAWSTAASPESHLLVTAGWHADGWASALTHCTYAARHGAPLLFAGESIPPVVADALDAAGFGPHAPATLRFGHTVAQRAKAAFTAATT